VRVRTKSSLGRFEFENAILDSTINCNTGTVDVRKLALDVDPDTVEVGMSEEDLKGVFATTRRKESVESSTLATEEASRERSQAFCVTSSLLEAGRVDSANLTPLPTKRGMFS
jgi:hypothetical protein